MSSMNLNKTYPSFQYGEDAGKRLMRRERNKQAAARCRKRRLDHTMALQQVQHRDLKFYTTNI